MPDFSAHGYQTIRQLGLNAAGGRVVYLAADRKTQKQVAIKQFQFAKGAGWGDEIREQKSMYSKHDLED